MILHGKSVLSNAFWIFANIDALKSGPANGKKLSLVKIKFASGNNVSDWVRSLMIIVDLHVSHLMLQCRGYLLYTR